MQCELCKNDLEQQPVSIYDGKTVINLFDIEYPPRNVPFFVLEQETELNIKILHVVDMTRESTFSVGRNISNDIVIDNISVSRKQAYFKYQRPNLQGLPILFVSDAESRFGSFIRMPGLVTVTENMLPIQVERKVFHLKLEKRFTRT